MQVILLVAGLILLLVNPPLFAAAATVGWVCIGVFAAITALQLFVFALAAGAASKTRRSFDRW